MTRSPHPSAADEEAVFAALAHDSRRQILAMLSHANGELSSGALADRLPHAWPTTTRHLGVLEQAGLVKVTREGRSSRYRLDRERLETVVAGFLAHLAPAEPSKRGRPR